MSDVIDHTIIERDDQDIIDLMGEDYDQIDDIKLFYEEHSYSAGRYTPDLCDSGIVSQYN